MSWQDDIRDSFERLREQQQRNRPVVTPQKRKADEATGFSLLIGVCVGMLMMVREEAGHPLELALWLAAGLVLTIWVGSAREWPTVARVTGPALMVFCAVGLTVMGMAFSSFTGSLG